MSFTSESEETMIERGYVLEAADGVNVFYEKEGLIFDDEVIINYSIQPWMSRCETRGIHVDKEYMKHVAEERGDQAE